MRPYRFRSSWHVPGTREQVWQAVMTPEDWAWWWPAVADTELLDRGDADGVGRIVTYLVRAPLGYRLVVRTVVVRSVPPTLVEVRVSGNLQGRGRWTLRKTATGVEVDQLWEVAPTRPWMRVLDPLARPAFRFSHDLAARRGGAGLARWMERATSRPPR